MGGSSRTGQINWNLPTIDTAKQKRDQEVAKRRSENEEKLKKRVEEGRGVVGSLFSLVTSQRMRPGVSRLLSGSAGAPPTLSQLLNGRTAGPSKLPSLEDLLTTNETNILTAGRGEFEAVIEMEDKVARDKKRIEDMIKEGKDPKTGKYLPGKEPKTVLSTPSLLPSARGRF